VYPYFLPLVILGIFLRIYEKKWSKAETILLLLFVCQTVLMLFQFIFYGGDVSRRYFLPNAPLLFGWAGYALYRLSSCRIFHWLFAICIPFLLADAFRPSLEYLWKKRKKEEIRVVRELSVIIRRDWQGQSPFFSLEILEDNYFSPKRPLVRCDSHPSLGYASGGSGISYEEHRLPLPDYRVFENSPVAPPYAEIYQFDYFEKTYRIGKRVK